MLRFALLLLLPFFCCAQSSYHANPIRFTAGLPSDVVLGSLKQDNFLYVATQRGLCLYDGYIFVNAPDVNNVVSSLYSDGGRIYFEEAGTGLCVKNNIYANKQIISPVVFTDADPDNDHFQNIYKDPYGNIWCSDFHHVKYLSAATRKWRAFNIAPQNQQLDFAVNYFPYREGLLITSPAGIFYWDSRKDALSLMLKEPIRSAEQRPSGIFYFDSRGQLSRFLPGKNISETLATVSGDNGIFVKQYPSGNELMYFSNDALYVYDIAQQQERKLFDATDQINHVYYDTLSAIIWISTQHGMVKLQRNNEAISTLMLPEESAYPVSEIIQDDDGNLWLAGASGNILQRTSQGTWKKYQVGKAVNDVSAKGNHLYITTDSSIYRISGAAVPRKIITTALPLKKALEADGKIWVAPVKGSIRVYDTGTFKEMAGYLQQDSSFFQQNFVNDICLAQGKIWLASWAPQDYGIAFFNPHRRRFESVSKLKGNDSMFVADYYNRIAVAPDGSLLFSAFGGWNRVDANGHILQTMHSRAYNIANDNIQGMAEDAGRNIWFGCAEGLYQFNSKTKAAVRISEIDGLASNNITRGFCLTGKRWLYIATEKAVQQIDLEKVLQSGLINQLRLTAIRYNGAFVPFSSPVISFKEKDVTQVEFYFSALNYADKEKVVYRYRLDDGPWNYLGTNPYLQIIKPAAGRYSVTIEAGDNLGNWQSKTLQWQLDIVPPFYKTWWFYALLILLAGLAAWRINRYLVRQEKLKGNLRRKIKENENRMLRSQMNPHFMFNSLNSINSFIIQNKKEEATLYLTSFSRLMRKILDNSRREYITLQEELDTTRLYLKLEAARMDDKFTYTIRMDKDLEDIHIPPLILQPFLENAIWHGISHKAGKGVIDILIGKSTERPHELIIKIVDNGVGRVAAGIKEGKAKAYKSHGLDITTERLKMSDAANSVVITDLYDAGGESSGTMVQLKIIYSYD